MPAKHLVIGLDGADLGVVRELGSQALPTLYALMKRGAYAPLRSIAPAATLPNWLTFLTGLDPAAHGVFDFTTRHGYDLRFTAGQAREASTLFARLDQLGKRVACISFPGTWPPEKLARGAFISGWDSPVAFESDRSFIWPSALHDAIATRFGTLRFDDVDEFHADAPGWHDQLPSRLVERIECKAELGSWLIDREDWDLFAIYFGESDTAAHHLWSLHDEHSPRRPAGYRGPNDGLRRVYAALDAAIEMLIDRAGEDVELTLLSDHGFGGSSDKVLYLNRVLEEAGLLAFRKRGGRARVFERAKQLALRRLSPSMRARVFKLGGTRLAGLVEAQTRFGAIEMSQTRAFSEELNYFPSVWLNVAGREPEGIVPKSVMTAVRREVQAALLALRDPYSGEPVVRSATPREELYDGPFIERAPDLILELNLDEGYSYNIMPSASAGTSEGAWRRLPENEILGRKGRSMPGSHRSQGLFIATGSSIAPVGEIDAAIADVAATLLARMNIVVPPELCGRVLWEAFTETAGVEAASEPSSLPKLAATPTPELEGAVAQRLRALGYID